MVQYILTTCQTFDSKFVLLGFLHVVQYILTTCQTFDSKFVLNNLNVRTTAVETDMLFGHWFPPHITSLAGFNIYKVNVRHSNAIVLFKCALSI